MHQRFQIPRDVETQASVPSFSSSFSSSSSSSSSSSRFPLSRGIHSRRHRDPVSSSKDTNCKCDARFQWCHATFMRTNVIPKHLQPFIDTCCIYPTADSCVSFEHLKYSYELWLLKNWNHQVKPKIYDSDLNGWKTDIRKICCVRKKAGVSFWVDIALKPEWAVLMPTSERNETIQTKKRKTLSIQQQKQKQKKEEEEKEEEEEEEQNDKQIESDGESDKEKKRMVHAIQKNKNCMCSSREWKRKHKASLSPILPTNVNKQFFNLALFLNECCQMGPVYQVKPSVLLSAYELWCRQVKAKPYSEKFFTKKLFIWFCLNNAGETLWFGLMLNKTCANKTANDNVISSPLLKKRKIGRMEIINSNSPFEPFLSLSHSFSSSASLFPRSSSSSSSPSYSPSPLKAASSSAAAPPFPSSFSAFYPSSSSISSLPFEIQNIFNKYFYAANEDSSALKGTKVDEFVWLFHCENRSAVQRFIQRHFKMHMIDESEHIIGLISKHNYRLLLTAKDGLANPLAGPLADLANDRKMMANYLASTFSTSSSCSENTTTVEEGLSSLYEEQNETEHRDENENENENQNQNQDQDQNQQQNEIQDENRNQNENEQVQTEYVITFTNNLASNDDIRLIVPIACAFCQTPFTYFAATCDTGGVHLPDKCSNCFRAWQARLRWSQNDDTFEDVDFWKPAQCFKELYSFWQDNNFNANGIVLDKRRDILLNLLVKSGTPYFSQFFNRLYNLDWERFQCFLSTQDKFARVNYAFCSKHLIDLKDLTTFSHSSHVGKLHPFVLLRLLDGHANERYVRIIIKRGNGMPKEYKSMSFLFSGSMLALPCIDPVILEFLLKCTQAPSSSSSSSSACFAFSPEMLALHVFLKQGPLSCFVFSTEFIDTLIAIRLLHVEHSIDI